MKTTIETNEATVTVTTEADGLVLVLIETGGPFFAPAYLTIREARELAAALDLAAEEAEARP